MSWEENEDFFSGFGFSEWRRRYLNLEFSGTGLVEQARDVVDSWGFADASQAPVCWHVALHVRLKACIGYHVQCMLRYVRGIYTLHTRDNCVWSTSVYV